MSARMQFAGADWLREQAKYLKPAQSISEFGACVADILGGAFLGLYHIDRAVYRTDWTKERIVEINLDRMLATWDFNTLSILVVLCHDAAVRLEINGCGPRMVKLMFHPRERKHAHVWGRHPSLEEHARMIRERIADLRPDAERTPAAEPIATEA